MNPPTTQRLTKLRLRRGLLLLRRDTPLPRRAVDYFCSAAWKVQDAAVSGCWR